MRDRVEVELAEEPRLLVATLGAAIDVHDALGGFAEAFKRLQGLDLDAAAIILRAGLTDQPPLADVRRTIFATGVASLVAPLSEFLVLLSYGGHDPEAPSAGGDPVPHPQFHDGLLKIGMGWLGWSERQTRATTLRGVLLAHEGRIDMLQAIFGGGKPPPGKTPNVAATPNKLRNALRMLAGDQKGRRQPSPPSRKGRS